MGKKEQVPALAIFVQGWLGLLSQVVGLRAAKDLRKNSLSLDLASLSAPLG